MLGGEPLKNVIPVSWMPQKQKTSKAPKTLIKKINQPKNPNPPNPKNSLKKQTQNTSTFSSTFVSFSREKLTELQSETSKISLSVIHKSMKFLILNPAKDRAELLINHAANQNQRRERASPAASAPAQPLWHAALHNKLSFHTDQQLLCTAASASGLDARQWTGRESLPCEVSFQCQCKHKGYQFKIRGEQEQEFHHTE